MRRPNISVVVPHTPQLLSVVVLVLRRPALSPVMHQHAPFVAAGCQVKVKETLQSAPMKPLVLGVSVNGGTRNGWFIVEKSIKMDDLGVPLFQETTRPPHQNKLGSMHVHVHHYSSPQEMVLNGSRY